MPIVDCFLHFTQKNKKFSYKSRASFERDLELMVKNCYEYNELRNPHLLPTADKLLSNAKAELKEVC